MFNIQGLIKSSTGLERGIIISLWQKLQKKDFFSSSVKLSGYSQSIQLTCPFPQHHLERRKSQSLSNSNKVLAGFTEKRILSILLANDHGSPPHTTPALSIKTCCLKFWKEGKQQEGKLEVM